MIFYILFIVFAIVLAYVNNNYSKKLFYPPLYLCFIWILFVTLHLLFNLFLDHKPNKLSFNALSYFFVVIFLFSLGGLIAKGLKNNKVLSDIKISYRRNFLNIILLLNILFTKWFLPSSQVMTTDLKLSFFG